MNYLRLRHRHPHVTFHTAQAGDPVYDRFGNVVGAVAAADDLSVTLAIQGAATPWRITLNFVGENRDALRPSARTIAAIPGLRDEMFFLNRK